MLLPYASYLRVYEPVEQLTRSGPGAASDAPMDTVATVTLAQEQQTVLRRVIAPSAAAATDDLAGCYLLQRDGRLYACAIDLALRSWLALVSFLEETDPTTHTLFLVSDPAADAGPRRGAGERPGAPTVPHIRSATWGVPRSWFLLVTEEERETYDDAGQPSVRFRASMSAARSRLAAANGLLGAMIGDEELMDELDDLQGWLSSFADDAWLEVDYAGVARLLGARLGSDASAADIQHALSALQHRDFARAGEAYRTFVERWRVVNALERAN